MKLAITAMLLGMTAGFASAADNADDFAILSQKNIFLRDRQPPVDPTVRRHHTDDAPRVYVPDPPAKTIVLRGVVIEDNELHAYVENTRTGEVTKLVPGDAIADGHVSNIAIDAIAYEQNGNVQWVDVGQNLYGATVAAPPPTTAPSDGTANNGTAGPTTAPAADPALSSIEQRLRERRNRTQRNGK